MKDLANCNFVKTVLMLSVVLCHSSLFWRGDWFIVITPTYTDSFLINVSNWLSTFHVYGFAIASGYIYSYKKYEDGSYNNYVSIIKNKVSRLLIPFAFVCLIWAIPFHALYYGFDNSVFPKFILGESPAQLWFLLMLFWVFAIIDPLAKIVKLHPWVSGCFFLCVYLIAQVLENYMPNVFCILTGIKYLWFFWIGMSIRVTYTKSDIPIHKLVIFSIGCIVVNLLLFNLRNTHTPLTNIPIVKLCIGLVVITAGGFMAFFSLLLLARMFSWKTRFFIYMAKMSFPIYLFHQQIIYIILNNFNGQMPPRILTIVCFIGSMLLSLMVSEILNLSKITRKLIALS